VKNIETGNLGRASRRGQVARKHAHCGRLARAIGPEEAEDFAFFYGKRNVVDCGVISEGFRQVLNFYQSATSQVQNESCINRHRPRGQSNNAAFEPTFILKFGLARQDIMAKKRLIDKSDSRDSKQG